MNTDGASKGNPRSTATGGFFRDQFGSWKGGFECNLGTCSATLAKLWAMFYGLKLAWQYSFREVVLQLDSLVVKNMLLSGVSINKDFHNLLAQCRFAVEEWRVQIKHIFR